MRTVLVMIINRSRQRAIIYTKYEEGHVVRFLSYAVRMLKGGANISRNNPDERPPLRQPSEIPGKKRLEF
jgi:hypothetical protein